jgi:hypothetical protein
MAIREMQDTILEKECGRCHQFKPSSEFSKNKRMNDNMSFYCKNCEKKRIREYAERWEWERTHGMETPSEIECSMCHKILPISSFTRHKYSKDGYSPYCTECNKKRNRQFRDALRLKKQRGFKREIPEEKECRKCHRILPATEFFVRIENTDGLAPYCRECDMERQREYNSIPEVKEKLRKYRKEYRKRPEVREHSREYMREFVKKPEQRKRRKEYEKTPERKAMRREYNKKYLSKPEVKEHIKKYQAEYYSIPENIEKRKEYQKEYCARPEVKERRRKYLEEYKKRPGVREKLIQYKREYRKRKKANVAV